MTQNLKEHWADVRSKLLDLRPLFAFNFGRTVSVDYFDESLENNELEIALHALCDCVLAAPAPRITDAEIEKIELLHVKMELADDCVSSIRRKRGSSGLEISV